MKRLLLLLPLLLAAPVSAQSVFLKCSYEYLHVDGYTATGIHEFAINPVADSIAWTDGGKTHRPVTKGALVVSAESYYRVFPASYTTKVQISRVDGRFAMEMDFGYGGVVETNGQCSKAAAPKVMF